MAKRKLSRLARAKVYSLLLLAANTFKAGGKRDETRSVVDAALDLAQRIRKGRGNRDGTA